MILHVFSSWVCDLLDIMKNKLVKLINVSANHIEFLLNVRTWISTVQNRGRDGTLDLG